MISTAISSQLVIHTAADTTGLAQMTDAMQSWYRHPEFEPALPVLWDFRDAILSAPTEDVDAWSDNNRAVVNPLRAGKKTALVFGDSASAEFAVNLLGAHDWQHKVRIFNDDIEAARAWLLSTIR